MMVSRFLLDTACKYPGKMALEHNEDRLTYKELFYQAKKFALFLNSKQVGKDSRIVVLMPKSIRSVVAFYGANMVAASITQLDTDYPEERLCKILLSLEPSFIITTEKTYLKISQGMSNIPLNLIVDSWNTAGTSETQVYLWNEILEKDYSQEDRAFELIEDENATAYILFTSGSTGEPKGVQITNKNLVHYTKQNGFHYDQNSKVLNIVPAYYDAFFGEVAMSVYAGSTLILLDKFIFPNEITRVLHAKGITHFGATGYIISLLAGKLSDLEKYHLDSVKYIYFGGDSCLPKYLKRIKTHVPQVTFINSYGQTEATILVTGYEFSEIPENMDGALPIGKPYQGIEAYIFDQGKLLKPEAGQMGELLLAGQQIMTGYWKDQKATDNVIKTDLIPGERVLKTGDFVSVDEDGNLVFVGRNVDMVKRGGNRIFLLEIEQAILSFPEVTEVKVIGIESPENFLEMKTIVAFVQVRDVSRLSEIIPYLQKKLPRFMIPDEIIPIESLHIYNKTKVDKAKLKELYIKNQGG